MTKIFYSENREKAETFYTELQSYISNVKSVCIQIRSIGVEINSLELVFNAINGDFSMLQEEYTKIVQTDIEEIKSIVGREHMKKLCSEKISSVCKSISKLFINRPEPKKEKYIRQFIVLDKTEGVTLTAGAQNQIFEDFKEYIEDPILLKFNNAVNQAAESLQKLLDSAGKIEKISPLPYPFQFIMGLYCITDEGGNKYKITPRKLNFDYLRSLEIEENG